MSVSLIVLLPVILLGTVVTFCFVGCVFHTGGLAGPAFTKYSDTTVLANPAVVAYWPLGESSDSLPAVDRTPIPDNGKYEDPITEPGIYPWTSFSATNPPGPDILSAAAPGSISFAQPGIVAGDAIQPGNDPSKVTPCVVVNGCYVNVPFTPKINPPTKFTVEAWVRVDWDQNAPSAYRFVLDARDINPCTGFALLARADDNMPGVYHWQALIGNGSAGTAGFISATSSDPPIALNDPSLESETATIYYLAATFDGSTLLLYVNGQESGKANPATYMPNSTKPLWIGAGAPYVPLRPQPVGQASSPLFAFVGAIQDVAIYNDALTFDVILKHYNNGNGSDP
jgi:hypothetical protein